MAEQADSKPMTLERAATLIARCWKSREVRRLLRMIPDVKALKAHFLDAEAIKAGADKNINYTSASLKARAMLQHAPQVKAALVGAWEAIVPPGQSSMSRDEYFVMMRKLFLFAKIESADPDLDADDCVSTAFKDWAADADPGHEESASAVLSRDNFDKCWFQMADLSTDEVDANEYATWIREVVDRLTQTARPPSSPQDTAAVNALLMADNDGGGMASAGRGGGGSSHLPAATRVWRSDVDMIRELRDVCAAPMHHTVQRCPLCPVHSPLSTQSTN